MYNKFFVTGHRGFIGRHLTAELDRRGIEWSGYDLTDGQDIRDRFTLAKAIQQSRANKVLHLAARAGAKLGELYPEEYISTNTLGTSNVLRCAEEAGINVLVSYSSSSVLGESGAMGALEKDRRSPQGIYGITKAAGEDLVENAKGIPLRAVVRPFSVYGPDGRPDHVIYRWIGSIRCGRSVPFYGDGNATRGHIHVKDLVDGTLKLMLDGAMDDGRFRIVHLGGQEKVSLNDLCAYVFEVATELGYSPKKSVMGRYAWDISNSFSGGHLAQELLGWSPSMDFKTEVQKIVRQELPCLRTENKKS